jgi:toxin ParE1/3/4
VKLKIRISARAQRDLEDIWRYTRDHWNEDQAALYVGQVHAALSLLSANPGLSRTADDIRAGLRRYAVGSHVLFVRVDASSIRLVRVLHGRMDTVRHL